MKYQLVLQWLYNDISDYDELIAYEDLLNERLSSHLGEVDGHDCGTGEMNIFVFTDNPRQAFESCRTLICSQLMESGLSAGYREINGEEYIRLWPPASIEPFAVK
jgi:hypothetical protein